MIEVPENKRAYKRRTETEMREAMDQLLRHRHTLHIPARDDDADVVMDDVIRELLDLRGAYVQKGRYES